MEKLCIVKRRKSEVQVGPGAPENVYARRVYGLASNEIRTESKLSLARRSPPRSNFPAPDDQKLSIELTPVQADTVRSHVYFKFLSEAEADGPGLGPQISEGKMVFNIYLRQVSLTELLTSSDVCDMLRVSRTFLTRLVRDGKLKSYKIGRLRRFLLEDIRALLNGSSEGLLKGEDHVL